MIDTTAVIHATLCTLSCYQSSFALMLRFPSNCWTIIVESGEVEVCVRVERQSLKGEKRTISLWSIRVAKGIVLDAIRFLSLAFDTIAR